MSTLKTDAVTAISTNGDLSLDGLGSGVPDIGAGFKVGGTAGVPMASIRTTSGTASSSTFLRGDGTWNAAGGGAWAFLSKITFDNTFQYAEFDNLLDSTYDQYVVVLNAVEVATDNISIIAQTGVGGTPTYETTSKYKWGHAGMSGSSDAHSASGSGGLDVNFEMISGVGNGSNENVSGELSLTDPTSTASNQQIRSVLNCQNSSGDYQWAAGSCFVQVTTATTSIRIGPESGDGKAGSIILYGIKDS